jgi:hypothetical protein
MNAALISALLEQASHALILILSLYGVLISYKCYKTKPGADLLLLGFLLYLGYTVLALALPGYGGSYFHEFTMVATLESKTALHFLSLVFRLGLVFVIIGIYRISRSTAD